MGAVTGKGLSDLIREEFGLRITFVVMILLVFLNLTFYLQAAIVEQGITAKEYRESRVEVIVGCFMTSVIGFFIIVPCAGTYRDDPTDIKSGKQAALALETSANRENSIRQSEP